VKTVSEKVVGLSICGKMIGGGRPLLRDNLADTDPPPCKTPIFSSPKGGSETQNIQI